MPKAESHDDDCVSVCDDNHTSSSEMGDIRDHHHDDDRVERRGGRRPAHVLLFPTARKPRGTGYRAMRARRLAEQQQQQELMSVVHTPVTPHYIIASKPKTVKVVGAALEGAVAVSSSRARSRTSTMARAAAVQVATAATQLLVSTH